MRELIKEQKEDLKKTKEEEQMWKEIHEEEKLEEVERRFMKVLKEKEKRWQEDAMKKLKAKFSDKLSQLDGFGIERSSMVQDDIEPHFFDFSFSSDFSGNYFDEF